MGQKFPRGYLKKLIVSEAGPPDSCWRWPGALDPGGYGRVGIDGKTQYVHKAAYAHHYGTVPDGLVITHTCGQPSCFNPAHLEAVARAAVSRKFVLGKRGPNKYPHGHMQSLVTSEAGEPGDCWIWPGYVEPGGYGKVWLGDRSARAHRVSYEAHYGKIEEGLELDHLCHQRACFNYRHLRAVSRAENMRNTRRPKNNTSGHPGVYWHASNRKWIVQVTVNGKLQYFGSYHVHEEAIEVAKEARRQAGYIH